MSHLNFCCNYTSHLQKEERENMKKTEKGEKIVIYKFAYHLFGGIFVIKNVKKEKNLKMCINTSIETANDIL